MLHDPGLYVLRNVLVIPNKNYNRLRTDSEYVNLFLHIIFDPFHRAHCVKVRLSHARFRTILNRIWQPFF